MLILLLYDSVTFGVMGWIRVCYTSAILFFTTDEGRVLDQCWAIDQTIALICIYECGNGVMRVLYDCRAVAVLWVYDGHTVGIRLVYYWHDVSILSVY